MNIVERVGVAKDFELHRFAAAWLRVRPGPGIGFHVDLWLDGVLLDVRPPYGFGGVLVSELRDAGEIASWMASFFSSPHDRGGRATARGRAVSDLVRFSSDGEHLVITAIEAGAAGELAITTSDAAMVEAPPGRRLSLAAAPPVRPFEARHAAGSVCFSAMRACDRGQLSIGGLNYWIGNASHQWHVFLDDHDETSADSLARRVADLVNFGSTAVIPHPTFREGPRLPPHPQVMATAAGPVLRLMARQPGEAGNHIALAWPGDGSAWADADRDVTRVVLSGAALSGGRAAEPSAADRPGGPLSITSFGARGDGDPAGKTDNLRAFQAGIAAMAARGGGALLVPAGRYVLPGGVTLPTAVMLVGEGAASWLDLQGDASGIALAGDNAGLRDLRVTQAVAGASCVHVSTGDRCALQRLHLEGPIGVHIGAAAGPAPRETRIEGNHIVFSGRALTMAHVEGLRVVDNTMVQTGDLSCNGVLHFDATDALVARNTVTLRAESTACNTALYAQGARICIVDNVLRGAPAIAGILVYADDAEVRDNRILRCGVGVATYPGGGQHRGLLVSGNVIAEIPAGGEGIRITDYREALIRDNVIRSDQALFVGMRVGGDGSERGFSGTLTGNHVDAPEAESAIRIERTSPGYGSVDSHNNTLRARERYFVDVAHAVIGDRADPGAQQAELATVRDRLDVLSAIVAPTGLLGTSALGAARFPSPTQAHNYGFPTGPLPPDAWFGFRRGDTVSFNSAVEYGGAKAQIRLEVPAGICAFSGLLTLSGNVNPLGAASYRSVITYLVSMGGSYSDALANQCVELGFKELHGLFIPRQGAVQLTSLHWGHERTGNGVALVGARTFSVILDQPTFYREIAAPDEPLTPWGSDPLTRISLHILHATD